MKKLASIILIFYFLLLSANLTAKSQKAHIHGLVVLTLAYESDTLEIQLESPAESLLGFEHKALQSKEKKVVEETQNLLNSPELLFAIKGANCRTKESSVDLSSFMSRDEHQYHEHESDSKTHSEKEHKEISASYLFSCEDGENLNAVSVNLFKLFPRIEKISAVWITESAQGAEMLNSKKSSISLRKQF